MKNYIVKSPGRTGSIYVAQWLAKNQGCIYLSTHNENFYEKLHKHHVVDKTPVVLHDHYDFVPLRPNDWVLVLSDRRNKFDGILSWIIAEKTENWSKYEQYPNSITIDFADVKEKHIGRKRKINADHIIASTHPWYGMHKIYQEDINNEYLKKQLSYNTFEPVYSKYSITNHRSPYNKRQYVTNYWELKKQYKKWLKQ